MRTIVAVLMLFAAAVLPTGEASASAQDCYFRTPFGCFPPFVRTEPAQVFPGGKVTVITLVRCDGTDVPRTSSPAFTAPAALPAKEYLRYFNGFRGTATVSSKARAGVTPVTATCSGKYSVTGTFVVLPGPQAPSKPKTPTQVSPKPKGAVQTGGGGTAPR